MKSKPILFSTPMVQAILEGTKTQTRRIVKPQPKQELEFFGWKLPEYIQVAFGKGVKTESLHKFPFGEIGDLLWVRETFRPKGHSFPIGEHFEYKATAEADGNPINEPWKPSIFMPKDAARIFLKITNIRVERLFNISDQDAISEGVEVIHRAEETVPVYKNYLISENKGTTNPRKSFLTLWESINGTQSINDNPWVWVIEFERIEKPSEV
jgi:hypothetical protein